MWMWSDCKERNGDEKIDRVRCHGMRRECYIENRDGESIYKMRSMSTPIIMKADEEHALHEKEGRTG
jgi:hypothetical protein